MKGLHCDPVPADASTLVETGLSQFFEEGGDPALWDEFAPSRLTPTAPSALIAAAAKFAGKSPQGRRCVVAECVFERLLEPLMGNLRRACDAAASAPTDVAAISGVAKVSAIRTTQPLLAFALKYLSGAVLPVLRAARFELADEFWRWMMLETFVSAPTETPRSLALAAAAVAHGREVIAAAEPQSQRAAIAEALATRRAVRPPPVSAAPALVNRGETAPAVARDEVAANAAAGASDEVPHLLDAARGTLHRTGRLRNAAFNGYRFVLRRSDTPRRIHACGDATCDAGDGVEVHWHLRAAPNILYAFTAHCDAACTRVLHLGDEIGYQYVSIPGSRHFGKTVLTSKKLLDEAGHLLRCTSFDNPVTHCMCGVPFTELWD
jgi:hypothetical protein